MTETDRGPSDDAIQLLYDEAKRRVDVISRAISEIDDRIQGIVRFNVLVLGLFIPALSLILQKDTEISVDPGTAGIPIVFGFGALVVSTILAVSAYLKRGTAGGVDAATLAGALDFDITEQELQEELIRTYRLAAAEEEELLERTARRFRLSLLALIAGLFFLLAATITLWVKGGS